MEMKLAFCALAENDFDEIVSAFKKIGWNKPKSTYETYFQEQKNNIRSVIVAKANGKFCGYVTLKWKSDYEVFAQQNIPEISDLNVLPSYRKHGIGTALIHACETIAKDRSYIKIGMGVGMTADYGNAQRLYVNLEYIPDGHGLHSKYIPVKYGDQIAVDDDLTLFFTKSISSFTKQAHPETNFHIKLVEPTLAEKICRDITADLPDYFGIPEANERYAHGMLDRVSFAAMVDNQYVGLLTIEFPFANNANIYWMAVKQKYQGHTIGAALVQYAEEYCRSKDCMSLTVETLSTKNKNEDYLKTYRFYEKCGFKPLFELNTYGPDFLMVYMQKLI